MIIYYTKSEDRCEESIEDFQGEGNCAGLVVMLNCHGDHVEEDQNEDRNFKSVDKDNGWQNKNLGWLAYKLKFPIHSSLNTEDPYFKINVNQQ